MLETSASSHFTFADVGSTKISESTYRSSSPVSAVVSCDSSAGTAYSERDTYGHISGGCSSSSTPHFNQALRKLELQLSLDDDYDCNDVQERNLRYNNEEYSQAESHIDSRGGFGYPAGDNDSRGPIVTHISGLFSL